MGLFHPMQLRLRAPLLLACATMSANCAQKKRVPFATGSMVFNGDPAEIGVLQSEAFQRKISDRLHLAIGRTEVAIRQRDNTAILQITIRATDPNTAKTYCDEFLRTYVDERLALAKSKITDRLQQLDSQLDDPKFADTRAAKLIEITNLEAKQHLTNGIDADARILETCTGYL
jgi:hypothetical protein